MLKRSVFGRVVGGWRVAVVVALAVVGLLAATPGAWASAPAFTQVSGSPFSPGAGTFPQSVAFSPDGLLATANLNAPDLEKVPGAVSVFSTGSDGTLTQVGSPFATGATNTVSAVFSPNGGLLAAANVNGPVLDFPSFVSVFSVGPDGALTPVNGSPFATGPEPFSLAFSPSGRLLATANAGDNTVSVFSVASDGALAQVNGSPFATGNDPLSVAFSPSGRLLAIANAADNTVSVFSVASDGALTQVNGSPFASGGNGPSSVAFSPHGGLLAVTNFGVSGDPPLLDNRLSVFSVASDGALTAVNGSPFRTGDGAVSVAFSASGRLLATANGGETGTAFAGNTVSVFSVASNGALTQVDGSPFTTGNAPISVAFSASGRLLATANGGDSTVTVYALTGSAQAATLVTDSSGLPPGKALAAKATAIQTAVKDLQTATACAGITDYLGLVRAQTGKKLSSAQAAELTTDATNLATALGC